MRFIVFILILSAMDCQARPASETPTWKELTALIGAKTSSDQFKTFVSRHDLTKPRVVDNVQSGISPTLIFSNGHSISVFVVDGKVTGATISPGENVKIGSCLPHAVKGPLNKNSILLTLSGGETGGVRPRRPEDAESSVWVSHELGFSITFHKDDLEMIDFFGSYQLLSREKQAKDTVAEQAAGTGWFKKVLQDQEDAQLNYSTKQFLILSEFTDDDNNRLTAWQFCAYEDGFVYRAGRSPFDTRDASSYQLSAEEIGTLHRYCAELKPPDSAPRKPAIIVSFLKDNVWYTYTYDKDQMSDALRAIRQLNISHIQGMPFLSN